jgi:hypothetical protein
MREIERKLILDSLSSVMPYLVYPQELKALVEKVLGECSDINTFLEKFKQSVSVESDQTHKTDGQIFANELRKKLH